jgi:hypothetical protein
MYNGSVEVGAYGGYEKPFSGHIDQLRFFNRALTDAEVLELYNEFGPHPTPLIDIHTTYTSSSGTCSTDITEYNANYPVWKAFDDLYAAGSEFVGRDSGSVTYEFTEPKIVTKYEIHACMEQSYYTPTFWDFRGSNNGIDWTVLDLQSDIVWNSPGEIKQFEISNTTSYKFYNLTIPDGSWGSFPGLGRLQMYGYTETKKDNKCK